MYLHKFTSITYSTGTINLLKKKKNERGILVNIRGRRPVAFFSHVRNNNIESVLLPAPRNYLPYRRVIQSESARIRRGYDLRYD